MKHNNSLSAILLSLKEKKLHPNQKELDKDGDGDIDPKDFAMLRKQAGKINKKKDKEEVEEAQMDKMKKVSKGFDDRRSATLHNDHLVGSKKASGKSYVDKHSDGKFYVVDVKEESVNELSKKTLGSYAKKAMTDKDTQSRFATEYEKRGMAAKSTAVQHKNFKKANRADDKFRNRTTGINKAIDKLTKESSLDEISKTKMGQYINRAHSDKDTQTKRAGIFDKKGMDADKDKDMYKQFDNADKARKKAANRTAGIGKAVNKLTKESNISNKSADKKPEEYTDEKGMKRTRMVPVDRQVLKDAMPSQADAIKALNKKTAAQKAKNTDKLKAAGKMMPTKESIGKTAGDSSYHNLQKAKRMASKDGHDYDKLPAYDRTHDKHREYYDNKAKTTKESTDWPIYRRIMEKANHTSDSKTSEPMDSKLQPFEKKMVDAHKVTPPNELVDVNKAIEKNLKTLSTAPIKQAAKPNGQ